MNEKRVRCVTLLVTVLALLAFAKPSTASKNDVLVVPALQQMVGLAYDIHALRDVVLITYRGNASSAVPLMHVWNPVANVWQQLSGEEYAFGQFMNGKPNNFYIVGTDSDLPPFMEKGTDQARRVIRIHTHGVAEAANAFNETMTFTAREWSALAERHGLQTRDLNYEKRKWGRFGPPGTHIGPPISKPAPVESVDETLLVPGADQVNDIGANEGIMPTQTPTETPVIEAPVIEPVTAMEVKTVFIPDATADQSLEPNDVPEPLEVLVPSTVVMRPEDK